MWRTTSGHAADVERHARRSRRDRLERGVRQVLGERRQHEYVGRSVRERDLGLVDEVRERPERARKRRRLVRARDQQAEAAARRAARVPRSAPRRPCGGRRRPAPRRARPAPPAAARAARAPPPSPPGGSARGRSRSGCARSGSARAAGSPTRGARSSATARRSSAASAVDGVLPAPESGGGVARQRRVLAEVRARPAPVPPALAVVRVGDVAGERPHVAAAARRPAGAARGTAARCG